jgi:hypothetical protein
MTTKNDAKRYSNYNLNSSLTKPAPGPSGAGVGLQTKSGLLVLKVGDRARRGRHGCTDAAWGAPIRGRLARSTGAAGQIG